MENIVQKSNNLFFLLKSLKKIQPSIRKAVPNSLKTYGGAIAKRQPNSLFFQKYNQLEKVFKPF